MKHLDGLFKETKLEKATRSASRLLYTDDMVAKICSAINYLSNGINILARDDSIPIKSAPKETDRQ